MIDGTQCTIALIDEAFRKEDPSTGALLTGKKVLKQMESNRVWKNDRDGKYASVQFNGMEFKFRPGKTITVSKTVGDSLIRSSVIVIGDKKDFLTNPGVPFLVKLEEHVLGTEMQAKYSCPDCHVDFENPAKLARHLMDPKAHEKAVAQEEQLTDDVMNEALTEAEVG